MERRFPLAPIMWGPGLGRLGPATKPAQTVHSGQPGGAWVGLDHQSGPSGFLPPR